MGSMKQAKRDHHLLVSPTGYFAKRLGMLEYECTNGMIGNLLILSTPHNTVWSALHLRTVVNSKQHVST